MSDVVEIIDVNGVYDPNKRQHHFPGNRDAYFKRLSNVVSKAAKIGYTILYSPNYGWDTERVLRDPDELQAALASDPFLAAYPNDDLVILPAGVGRGLSTASRFREIEDSIVNGRNPGTCPLVVCLGAYTTMCVLFNAQNVLSRNPFADVRVDSSLSIDSPDGAIKHIEWPPGVRDISLERLVESN